MDTEKNPRPIHLSDLGSGIWDAFQLFLSRLLYLPFFFGAGLSLTFGSNASPAVEAMTLKRVRRKRLNEQLQGLSGPPNPLP
jgi:hypothetical protein